LEAIANPGPTFRACGVLGAYRWGSPPVVVEVHQLISLQRREIVELRSASALL
jgi:hypothetical protein